MRSNYKNLICEILLIVMLVVSSLLVNSWVFEVRGDGACVEIVDVVWGTTGNPIAVSPGDEGVILTLVLQNSGSEVVSGVSIYVYLRPPFHNTTGGDLAKGYVASIIQPGQLSTVQFLLGVDENASVGCYRLEAKLSYMTLKQSSETQSMSVSESEQRGSSTSRTSSSQSTSTSGIPPDTNSTTRSSSETTQSSTSNTKQTTSSSSTSYTKYTVDRLEKRFNVTLWITGKVVLDVEIGVNSIFAGSESAIPIEITNKGTAPASSLSVTLTLPSGVTSPASSVPLVLLGEDNYWYFQSLSAGESVEIRPEFFASNNAIDVTFQMQIVLNYRDNVGTIRTEQRNVGILVRGPIMLVFQEVSVIPPVVGAGGNVTVTGTVTNEGSVSAMYTNASLLTIPPFVAYDATSVYIGEVLPNTPMPFSLNIGISKDADNGTYTLPLLFYYKDNYHNTYSIELPLSVTVQGVTQQQTSQQSQPPELFTQAQLVNFVLVVIVAALCSVITYFVTKHRSISGKG